MNMAGEIIGINTAIVANYLDGANASGAGAEMRQAMGVAVFAGMLGVTLFGLFFTPLFYVALRRLARRRRRYERRRASHRLRHGPGCRE